MRNIFLGIVIGVLLSGGFYGGRQVVQNFITSQSTVSPLGKFLEKPLEKYSILRLAGRTYDGSQIILDEATATTSAYTAYTFHFTSDGKKVTGLAHIPGGKGPFPVIIQFRGFIEPETYTPGAGTRHSAEVFAAAGFISLAPDFLGFGGSDMPSDDVFEARFETYTTALSLFESVTSLPMADAKHVGIWGHSNGGQIALTVLEVLSRPIPASLWAPVSKPFPYSILYYTDEAEDHGKALRKELSEFEQGYNADLYSLTNYLHRITGPVQIHQGTADTAVPLSWSDMIVDEMKKTGSDVGSGLEVTYFIYPGADHDMNGAWNTVIGRDINYFRTYLQ